MKSMVVSTHGEVWRYTVKSCRRSTIVALLAFALITFVQQRTFAASAPLVDVGGGIDCLGTPFSSGAVVGEINASRSSANVLTLSITLTSADPSTIYSIEAFEAVSGCGRDDAAAIGTSAPTVAFGAGSSSVSIHLPHPTIGGAVLGDGPGTETIVVVLDSRNSSCGCGDRFVATLQLPSLPSDDGLGALTKSALDMYITYGSPIF